LLHLLGSRKISQNPRSLERGIEILEKGAVEALIPTKLRAPCDIIGSEAWTIPS